MDISNSLQRSISLYRRKFWVLFPAVLLAAIIATATAILLSWLLIDQAGGGRAVPALLFMPLVVVGAAFAAGSMLSGLLRLGVKLFQDKETGLHEIVPRRGHILPAGVILSVLGLIWYSAGVISAIPVIGFLASLALILSAPALLITGALAVDLAANQDLPPPTAIRRAVGIYLTEPVELWLYAFIIGLLACLGLVAYLFITAVLTAVNRDFTAAIAPALFFVCLTLTLPMALAGLAAVREELVSRPPARVMWERRIILIALYVWIGLFGLSVLGGLALGWRRPPARGAIGRYLPGVFSFVWPPADARPDLDEIGPFADFRQLPENFPSDLPVYPGAQIQGHFGAFVSLESGDELDDVLAYYEIRLKREGWSVTVADLAAAEKELIAVKQGGRTARITLTVAETGGTAVLMSYGGDGA